MTAVFGDSQAPNLVAGADRYNSIVLRLFERQMREPWQLHFRGACLLWRSVLLRRGEASRRRTRRAIKRYWIFPSLSISRRCDCPCQASSSCLHRIPMGEDSLKNFVGDSLVLSDIDSFNNIAQVSEYWWQFGFLRRLHDGPTG